MGHDAEIDQLIEAVKRQPGARAFALLAERYLDQERVGDALAVCRAGFAANPSYERGAVVYLNVLRRANLGTQAQEVYQQAIALHARSAKLRVARGLIALDQGDEGTARALTQQALDLDPSDQQARAILATLGGPSPIGTREYRNPPARPQAIAPAALRGRIRPIGERKSATSLFDLSTPAPTLDRPHDRSPFYSSPTPLEKTGEVPAPPPIPTDPAPPKTGERDLFPDAPQPKLPRISLGTGQAAPRPIFDEGAPQPGLQAQDSALLTPSRRRRRWPWITALTLLVIVGATAGFFLHRQYKSRAAQKAIADALSVARDGRLATLRQSEATIRAIQGAPKRRDGALALIAVDRLVRYAIGDRSRVGAWIKRSASSPEGRLAGVLLEAASGDATTAANQLSGIKLQTWYRRLAQITIAARRVEAKRLPALLDAELRRKDAAPGILLVGARALRLAGDKRARAYLAAARKLAPNHAGIGIESALLDADRGVPIGTLRQLKAAAGEVIPYRARIALLLAIAAHQAGKGQAAAAAIDEAIRLDPSDAEAAAIKAIWKLGPGGNVPAGLAALKTIGPPLDKSPRVRLARALALLQLGRPAEASRILGDAPAAPAPFRDRHAALVIRAAADAGDTATLDRACAKASGDGALVACVEGLLGRTAFKRARARIRQVKDRGKRAYLRGLLKLTRGDARQAIKALRQARTAAPTLAPPLLALAQAYTLQNDAPLAVKTLRLAIKLDARSVRSRAALAIALVAAGHDTEARALLDEVVAAKPSAPRILASTGLALLDMGSVDQARAVLRGADVKALATPTLRILAGKIARAEGKLVTAEKLFQAILRQNKRSTAALIELGRIAVARRKRGSARRYFARAIRLRPKDPDLLLQLAKVHAQARRWGEAYQSATQAITRYKKSGQPLRATEAKIAIGRLLRQGDRAAKHRAEALLFDVCTSKSAPAPAFYELGMLYRSTHDLAKAVWAFRRATRRDPQFANAFRELGLALRSKPKWRRMSRSPLRQYLKLAPEAKDVKRIKALLGR